MAYPKNHDRMFLTCYTDTFGYGWHHVDWGVDQDGPEAADAVTAQVEPQLRRTSEWKHGFSENGLEYWTADAAWA